MSLQKHFYVQMASALWLALGEIPHRFSEKILRINLGLRAPELPAPVLVPLDLPFLWTKRQWTQGLTA